MDCDEGCLVFTYEYTSITVRHSKSSILSSKLYVVYICFANYADYSNYGWKHKQSEKSYSSNFDWGGYCLQPLIVKKMAYMNFSDCILNDLLKNYIFFLLGIYILPSVIQWLRLKHVYVIGMSALVAGNCVVLLFGNNMLLRFCLAIVGSCAFIGAAYNLPNWKIISYLGKQTMPIYVLQGFAIAGSRLMLTKLHLNDSLGLIPLTVCSICGVLIPLVAYWVSKRIWKLEAIFYPTKYIPV